MKNKLRSRRGASVVMALVFLLVGLTIGGIVLATANANASRLRRDRQDRQNYLAVASAVRTLEEELEQLSFQGSYRTVEVRTETVTITEDETGKPQYSPPMTSEAVPKFLPYENEGGSCPVTGARLFSPEGELQKTLEGLYFALCPDPVTGVTPVTVRDGVVELPLTVSAGELPEVRGTLQLMADQSHGLPAYSLRLRLSAQADSGKDPYETVVDLPARAVTGQRAQVEVEESQSSTALTTVTTTTTTHTTQVTWTPGTVRKGGLQ